MILGVPYLPFLMGTGAPLLLSMYLSLYLLLLIPLVVVAMRFMAKKDEMIFRLIGLNLVFRFLPRNQELYGSAWGFSAARYRPKAHRLQCYREYL